MLRSLTLSQRRPLILVAFQALIILPIFTLAVTFPRASSGEILPENALETYIQLQDPVCNGACILDSFLLGKEGGVAAYAVFMISQAWRAPGEVVGVSGNNIWTHWLIVFIPDDPVTDTALLFINGESNDDPNPPIGETEFEIGAQIAQDTRSVVAVLFMVPNQPLQFSTEAGLTEGLEEDALVTFTWDRAMGTGGWLWPVYSPMTKSAVRGMDVVQAFVPAVTSGEVSVNDFVVTGFSKRGATTWLTAVVDERVIAIAPGVFDVLNFAPQAEHHLGVYGFFTSALDDFVNHDIPWRLRIPEGQDLRMVVDPFSYRNRLALPKYVINSTGDQFYPPDSARFYFSDLPGEKLLRYVPNSDHSLSNSETALETTLAGFLGWYKTVLSGAPRPEITWSLDEATGELVVHTSLPAPLAQLWQATNPDARDFRLETLGEAWTELILFGTGDGVFIAQVSPPPRGWTAYFVELLYPLGVPGAPFPQAYSTQVFVTPDVVPFDIADPIKDPRGFGFWKHQFRVAQTGRGHAQVDRETLEGFFPFRLFDGFVTSVEDATEIFSAKGRDLKDRARQQCLAVRLNVLQDDLGWYSRADGDDGRFLWEFWNEAHTAFLAGEPEVAKTICEELNEL